MGKSQRQKRKAQKQSVTFSLQKFHQPPELWPNKYYYIAECQSGLKHQDCNWSCTFKSIPTGGTKEFYICSASGEKLEKWDETYYYDRTPTKFRWTWVTPRPSYGYSSFASYPGIPWGGWIVERGDPLFRNHQEKEDWLDYVARHPGKEARIRNPLGHYPRGHENPIF